MTAKLTRTTLYVSLGLMVLSGCATGPVVEKKLPATALECRQDIYDNPTERNAVLATGGGLSLGASLAIAVTSGMMTNALANRNESSRLASCYDRVGAASNERLPLTAATKAHDNAVLAGETPPKVAQASVATHPARRGPGGGAGFGSF